MNARSPFTVTLISFGFRYGPPADTEIMMDVRFLKNPHWDETLRPGSGRDRSVGDYIARDPNFAIFMTRFQDLVSALLPLYEYNERHTLTIALGCTGGRHRSVYAAERLKDWLESRGVAVTLSHRDVDRPA